MCDTRIHLGIERSISMFKTDFLQKREDGGSIQQTCAYVEKGAHEW